VEQETVAQLRRIEGHPVDWIFGEVDDFPISGKQGETEFIRSIIFSTRIIPFLNEVLAEGLRADWGVVKYRDNRGIRTQEVDLAIYRINGDDTRIWNGWRSEEPYIRLALLSTEVTKAVLEVKKTITLSIEFWADIAEKCALMRSLNIDFWLIGERCDLADLRAIRRRAFGLGCKNIFLLSTFSNTKGEVSDTRQWDRFLTAVSRIRV